jgi:hypothetical protein
VSLLPVRRDETTGGARITSALGSLETYNDRIVGLLSIPTDVLPPILQMLLGDRFKFVSMSGTKFHYRTRLQGFRGSDGRISLKLRLKCGHANHVCDVELTPPRLDGFGSRADLRRAEQDTRRHCERSCGLCQCLRQGSHYWRRRD